MAVEALTSEAVQAALIDLKGWSYSDDSLKKTFKFKNFKEAMGFMVRLSFEAEALNHHPEIYNVYGTVNITLRTHDAGNKVTGLDIKLAQAIEAFAWV